MRSDPVRVCHTELEHRLKRRRAAVKQRLRSADETAKAYATRVEVAERAVEQARQPLRLAGVRLASVTVYDDRVVINGTERPLTPDVRAAVDTAGAHDGGKLVLVVEGPGWADTARLDGRLRGKGHQLAQAINLAARAVEAIRADRARRVAEREAILARERCDHADLDAACAHLAAAHTGQRELREASAALVAALEGADPDGRAARRARKLLEDSARELAGPVPEVRVQVNGNDGLPWLGTATELPPPA